MGKPLAEQGSLPLQKPIDPATSEPLLEHPIHISENLAAFKRGSPKGMPLDPTGDCFLLLVVQGTSVMELEPASHASPEPRELAADRLWIKAGGRANPPNSLRGGLAFLGGQ